MACLGTIMWVVLWAYFMLHLPIGLRMLVLDYVMTFLVVVVKSNVDICVLIY